MSWAQQAHGDADRAKVAIEFLQADIDGIARESTPLAQGVLDNGDGDAATVSRGRAVPLYPHAGC